MPTEFSNGREVVDNLPTDETHPERTGGEPPHYEQRWAHLTDFIAYVRRANITASGEIQITLGVPYEYKYNALQMTDLRGIAFVVQVARPLRPGEEDPRELEGGSGEEQTVVNHPTLRLVDNGKEGSSLWSGSDD